MVLLAVLLGAFTMLLPKSFAQESRKAVPKQVFGADKLLSRYVLDVWQSENGMPSSTVLSVLQTTNGYIWLGTFGGLVRFDGVQFTTFNSANTPLLKANGVFGLHQDRARSLWAATQESGILRYANGKFSSLTSANGLSDDFVRVFAEEADNGGTLWLGTNKGLDKLTRNANAGSTDSLNAAYTLTPAKKLPNPITDRVNALCMTAQGMWVGCNSKGLYFQTSSGIQRFGEEQGLNAQSIFALYQSRNGTLWVGTGNGVFMRTSGNAKFAKLDSLGTSAINGFYEDNEGNIWVAADIGVFRLSNEEGGNINYGLQAASFLHLHALTKKDGLSDDRITSIMQDKEGSIWLGTYYGGLNRLKRGKFTTMTEQEGLLGNVIYSILAAREGSIWLGMIGGVQEWKNGQFTNYTDKNGLPANTVRALYEDRSGAVWVGMYGGLSKIVNGKITTYTEKNGLVGNRVRSILQTRDGTLWIGTTSGLNAWFEGKGVVATYTTANGLPHNSVITLHEDRLGRLWVGTDGGGVLVLNLADSSKTVYTVKQGLMSNVILSIFEEPTGDMWLSTARGLNRVRTLPPTSSNTTGTRLASTTIASLSIKNGLPGESISQIMPDELGQYWIGSQNGIMCVEKQHLHNVADGKESILKAQLFKRSDGMRTDKCNIPATGTSFPDGTIWFPTTKGLVIINPRKIPTNKLPPPVVVSTLYVDTLSASSTSSDAAFITIPFGSKKFEFQYTALSFLFPEKVLFKYKLDGFDNDWTEAGTRRTAYYTNLNHGTYSFHVIACNNDGIWNDDGAVLTMTILPPWWETWWFRVCQILFFITLLGISFVMNRYGTRTRIATVITFITLLVIFETLVSGVEGYVNDFSGGVPVLELLMNVILAAILSPVERVVAGYFEKQRGRSVEQTEGVVP
jgi:ligand-binding sensor domain-containing protein